MKSAADNIWEILAHHGLTLLRGEDHVVQHVKWLDEVPEKKYEFPMYGTVKKDGNNGVLLSVDSCVYLLSRKGNRYVNCEQIEESYESKNLENGVYLTELCHPTEHRAVMSGWVSPNRKEPLSPEQKESMNNCELWFFDALTLPEFIEGSTNVHFVKRRERLFLQTIDFLHILNVFTLATKAEVDAFSDRIIGAGEEGVVLYYGKGDYLAGHKGFRCMKVVKTKTFDMKLLKVESGKGKNAGQASTFYMEDGTGRTVKVGAGKGWDDARCKDALANQQNYIGKVFEVYSFEVLASGLLRQPKIGVERFDKVGVDAYGKAN